MNANRLRAIAIVPLVVCGCWTARATITPDIQWTNIVAKGLSPVLAGAATTDDIDQQISTLKEQIARSAGSDGLHVRLAFCYLLKHDRLSIEPLKTASRTDNPWLRGKTEWVEDALSELDRAIQINDANAFAFYFLGYIHYRRRELDQAIRYTTRLVELSKQPLAYCFLSQMLREDGRYTEALTNAQTAVELDRRSSAAWIQAGLTLTRLGDYDRAILAADEAARLAPNDGTVMLEVGRIYHRAKKYKVSNGFLEKARVLVPNCAEVHALIGYNAFYEKRYKEALEDQQKALSIDPQYWDAYAKMGEVYHAMGDHPQALAAFKKASDGNPLEGLYDTDLGIEYEAMGNRREAEAAYRRGYERRPTEPFCYQGIIGFYQSQGKDAEALGVLLQQLNRGLTNDLIVSQTGRSYLHLNDYARAKPFFEEAVRRCPTEDCSWADLANVYSGIGSNDLAINTARHAILLNPQKDGSYQVLGSCYSKIGDWGTSEKMLKKAMSLNATNLVAMLDVFLAARMQGRYQEAITGYQNFLVQHPSNSVAIMRLADSYEAAGLTNEAIRVLTDGTRVQPNNDEIWAQLGNVHYALGSDEALRCFDKAIELAPTNFVAYYGMGQYFLHVKRDPNNARKNLQMAVLLAPNDYHAYNVLGYLYAITGHADVAEQYFKKAVELNPRDAESWTSLGYGRYLRGDCVEAIRDHQRAIEANPNLPIAHYNMALACWKAKQYEQGVTHWHKARELGYPCDEKLLQELQVGLQNANAK